MSGPVVIDHARVGRPPNAGTTIYTPDRHSVPLSFEATFACHYQAIRDLCEAHHEPGLALLLAGPARDTAAAWLPARAGAITSATVGRHSAADLVLPGDETLSLRQLMVIVEPARRRWSDLRFRLLDLRTATGMVDERGRRLEALQSEGPCFVRCGRSVLFCLPTDDATGWPDDPTDGWACISERVYFDDEPAYRTPRPQLKPSRVPPRSRRPTTIRTHAGPREVGRHLLDFDERIAGRLAVRAGEREVVLLVGPSALGRGILLGRYPRCDVSHEETAAGGLDDRAISRVHLLIQRMGEKKVFAMDTGSTFGVQRAGSYVRQTQLEDGAEVQLAGGAATVSWSFDRAEEQR